MFISGGNLITRQVHRMLTQACMDSDDFHQVLHNPVLSFSIFTKHLKPFSTSWGRSKFVTIWFYTVCRLQMNLVTYLLNVENWVWTLYQSYHKLLRASSSPNCSQCSRDVLQMVSEMIYDVSNPYELNWAISLRNTHHAGGFSINYVC